MMGRALNALGITGAYRMEDYGSPNSDGVRPDDASFQAACIAASNAGGGTVIIANPHVLAVSYTVPSNVHLLFFMGGELLPASGVTITIPTSIIAGSYQIFGGAGTVTLTGQAQTLGTWSGGTSGTQLNRLVASLGTALAAGNVALSAGWGVGATVAIATGSDDTRGQLTVTAEGTPAANPTITITFEDGAFPVAPFPLANCAGGTGAVAQWEATATTTALTLTARQTPVAGDTYIVTYHVIG